MRQGAWGFKLRSGSGEMPRRLGALGVLVCPAPARRPVLGVLMPVGEEITINQIDFSATSPNPPCRRAVTDGVVNDTGGPRSGAGWGALGSSQAHVRRSPYSRVVRWPPASRKSAAAAVLVPDYLSILISPGQMQRTRGRCLVRVAAQNGLGLSRPGDSTGGSRSAEASRPEETAFPELPS